MRPGLRLSSALILTTLTLACEHEPIAPITGAGGQPNMPDTVWLDRPDRSGRLILPLLRGHDWMFTPDLAMVAASPAGFVSIDVIADSIYPGYPVDPNSFRLWRDAAGVGLVYAGEDSIVVVAPLAVDDTARVVAGSSVSIPVTFNDRTTPGAGAEVTEIVPPTHGDASATPDHRGITYSPEAGFSGTDSLRYVVLDAATKAIDTALVRVFVAPGHFGVVDMQAVGTSMVIMDIADSGWAVGTAAMPDGNTRAVRWRNGVAELLPIGRGVASTGERISSGGAVYGTVDGAPSYWRSGAAPPARVNAGTVLDMNGRGDLLLGRLVNGCLAATIWFPGGLIDVPAPTTKNCNRALKGLNEHRDVLWVNSTTSSIISVFQDTTGAVTVGPATYPTGEWVAFNSSLTLVGRAGRSSSEVPGYEGPIISRLDGIDFPAAYGGPGLTDLVDVNDAGWIVGVEGGQPVLLIGGARFRINDLIDPPWLQLQSAIKIANDGSMLGLLSSGERKVLRLKRD